MERLNLDLLSFDVGITPEHPPAFADTVAALVERSWDDGADAVVLPELLWMGLERFVDRDDPVRGVARIFWEDLWPDLAKRLSRPGKLVVLGSAPFVDEDGALWNRSPVLSDGRISHQDKIHLTPWESAFAGAGLLVVRVFRGVRIAVVICLDIEIPEISAALRGLAVDLILVPSATESAMGVERVNRCASARAVELGCYVGVSHLSGRMNSQLIDVNIGRLALYSPAQSAFSTSPGEIRTPDFEEGFHHLRVAVDISALRRNRALQGETDPSKVSARNPDIVIF